MYFFEHDLLFLLRALTLKECVNFEKHLKGIKHSEVEVRLLEVLKPKRLEPKISKKEIYKQVFNIKVWSDDLSPAQNQKLDQVCSTLFNKGKSMLRTYTVNGANWFELLSTLDREEFGAFRNYANSKIAKSRKGLLNIIAFLFSRKADIIQHRFKDWIFKSKLIREAYGENHSKFVLPQNLITKLNKDLREIEILLKEYITIQQMLNNKMAFFESLFLAYHKRGLNGPNHLGKEISTLEKYVDKHLKEEQNNSDYWKHKAFLSVWQYIYAMLNDPKTPRINLFIELIRARRRDYLVASLRLFLELKNREHIVDRELDSSYESNFDLLTVRRLIEHLDRTDEDHTPIVCVYYYLIKLLDERDDEAFQKKLFKKSITLVKEHDKNFGEVQTRIFYTYLTNFLNVNLVKYPDDFYYTKIIALWKERLVLTSNFERNPTKKEKPCAKLADEFIQIIRRSVESNNLNFAIELYTNPQYGYHEQSNCNILKFLGKAYIFYGIAEQLEGNSQLFYLLNAAKQLGYLRHELQGSSIGTQKNFYHEFYYRILRIIIKYDLWQKKSVKERFDTIKDGKKLFVDEIPYEPIERQYIQNQQFLEDLSNPSSISNIQNTILSLIRSGNTEMLYEKIQNFIQGSDLKKLVKLIIDLYNNINISNRANKKQKKIEEIIKTHQLESLLPLAVWLPNPVNFESKIEALVGKLNLHDLVKFIIELAKLNKQLKLEVKDELDKDVNALLDFIDQRNRSKDNIISKHVLLSYQNFVNSIKALTTQKLNSLIEGKGIRAIIINNNLNGINNRDGSPLEKHKWLIARFEQLLPPVSQSSA